MDVKYVNIITGANGAVFAGHRNLKPECDRVKRIILVPIEVPDSEVAKICAKLIFCYSSCTPFGTPCVLPFSRIQGRQPGTIIFF